MPDPSTSVPLAHLSAGEICKIAIHTLTPESIEREWQPVETFLGQNYTFKDLPSQGFRWIHIPVNNMEWAERCLEKLDTALLWKTSVRPALSDSVKLPLHSRHMKLKCEWTNRHDTSSMVRFTEFTVFLPYMNLDRYKYVRSLNKIYTQFQSRKPLEPLRDTASHREIVEHKISPFLKDRLGSSLHPRRTLDQFYYSSLDDTTSRDGDQIVSKWTGLDVGVDGRTSAADDSFMIMIDQLWCWVVDDNTVVSCFPSHDATHQGDDRFSDLYRSIRTCGHFDTVRDLYVTIIEQAIVHLHSRWNRRLVDYIEIYRWATSKKTAHQAMYFRDFHQGYSHGSTLFDDERELRLALEVADIVDELKMIKSLLEKQKIIMESLRSFATTRAGPRAWEGVESADSHLKAALSNVEEIKSEAEETYRSLLDLLDLKTKTASLAEARSTTKQGQAVMLFTIVTIIFLPLSFFTAYFGQNVSEITGDDSNPSSWDLWKVGTPITVVIILVALLIAYHIMRPNSPLWFWKRDRRSSSSSRIQGRDMEMGRR